MGKAQTLQAMSDRNRQQAGQPEPIKGSASADSLLSSSQRTPRGRDSPFGKLPDMLGVSKLTRSEVRKDLEEIEMLSGGASLAGLDDLRILPSVYPVKPRVELKIPEHLRAAQRAAQQAAAAAAETRDDSPMSELLEFLRLVEVVRPDILDAEREREQLESKYLSIRDNYVAEANRQSSNNKERFNFMRAMQAMLCRGICQYSLFGHHTGMLSDVLTVLEQKAEALRRLEEAGAGLERVRGALQSQPGAALRALTPERCSAVAVKRSDGSSVMLHAGMKLDTPFGPGEVQAVRLVGVRAVEIQLPFGLLFASPAETLQWFSFVNDESCASVADEVGGSQSSSNKYLAHRWQEERHGLYVPLDVQRNIMAHPAVLAGVEAAAALQRGRELSDGLAVADSTQLTGDIPDSCSESMDVDEEEAEQEAAGEEAPAGAERERVLAACENGLVDSVARAAISNCLPYLFAPPEALADISARVAANRNHRMLYSDAFVPNISKQNIESLQSTLNTLQNQLRELHSEKISYMNSVSLCGSEGAKLSEEVALTRLSMFTRRVRRRTVLAIEEVALEAPPGSVPKPDVSRESAVSPMQKASERDAKKPPKRGAAGTPQKPAPPTEPEREQSPSGAAGGGKARGQRGGTAEKESKKDAPASRGGAKRKSAGVGFEEPDAVDSSQRSEVSVEESSQKEAAAPRSKRSRKI